MCIWLKHMCKERTIWPLHLRVEDVLEPPKGVTNQRTKSNFVEYDGLVRGCPLSVLSNRGSGTSLNLLRRGRNDLFIGSLFFSRLLFWLKIGRPIVCEGPLRSFVWKGLLRSPWVSELKGAASVPLREWVERGCSAPCVSWVERGCFGLMALGIKRYRKKYPAAAAEVVACDVVFWEDHTLSFYRRARSLVID